MFNLAENLRYFIKAIQFSVLALLGTVLGIACAMFRNQKPPIGTWSENDSNIIILLFVLIDYETQPCVSPFRPFLKPEIYFNLPRSFFIYLALIHVS